MVEMDRGSVVCSRAGEFCQDAGLSGRLLSGEVGLLELPGWGRGIRDCLGRCWSRPCELELSGLLLRQ